jgi:AhpC/TSA family
MASGQDTSKKVYTKVTSRVMSLPSAPLDTNMLVYDEQGNALHYYQYSKLTHSGEYTLKYNGVPHTPGVKASLKKIEPQAGALMYQAMKPNIAIKSPLLAEGMELDITPFLVTFSKEEFDKKVVVLLFWRVGCTSCTEDFIGLNDFFKQVANPDNLIVIAVTPDIEQKVNSKMLQKPLQYARLYDNAGAVIDAYQLRSFPSYVVADKNHVIRFAVSASSPYIMPVFKSTIKQLLAQ